MLRGASPGSYGFACGRRCGAQPGTLTNSVREHLALFVSAEAKAVIFPGAKGGPLRRSNFNKMSAWPHAVRAIGAEGLHFHDLRHTGNHFAAASGASLKDLMARMGHDSERAAIIYQHEARRADLVITSAIDAHIEALKATQSEQRDGSRECHLRSGNGPLMARGDHLDADATDDHVRRAR
jgi:Phage integrase family